MARRGFRCFGWTAADRARAVEVLASAALAIGCGWTDARPGDVLDGWLEAARADGIAALPWMIAETGRPDYDGFLIRPAGETATAEVLRCE